MGNATLREGSIPGVQRRFLLFCVTTARELKFLQRLPNQPAELADHSTPEGEHTDHEDHSLLFSGTPVEYELPPPLLGQHTREVLGDLLGMRREELDRLAAMKVI